MRGYPCSFAFCQPARECAADCAGVRRLFPAPRHSGRRGIVAEEKQRLSGLYPAGIPEQKHLPLRSKGQDLSLPHHAAVNCGGLLPSPHTGKGAMMVRSAAYPASAPLPRTGHRRRQYPTDPICYVRKRSMVVRRTLFFCGAFRAHRQRKVANRYAGAANRKARQASLPAGLFCIFGAGLSAWPSACPASGRADTGYVYCCSAFASVPMYVSRV